jgi:hypothetical protein
MFDKDRKYYENEKNKKWGNKYGALMEPYLEKDIINFETTNKFKLPKNLRNYLINVSKENITGYYPRKIELEFHLYFLDKNGKNLYLTKELFEKFLYVQYVASELDDNEKTVLLECENYAKKFGYFLNYFMSIEENGCTCDTYLCINGPFYEKIGGLCNGGDWFEIYPN